MLMNSAMLKNMVDELAFPLTSLIIESINKGYFPDRFKMVLITPIHKGGDMQALENYRPISILPVMAKVFEKILKSRLVTHLDSRKILSDYQFGIRSGLCTQDAMLNLVKFYSNALDKRSNVVVKYLDLSKAFDCVDHEILLRKLRNLSLSQQAFLLLESYLRGRKQAVKLNGTISSFIDINMGVPQGSVLGPLLFILYVNDYPKHPRSCLTMYADDTMIAVLENDLNNAQNLAVDIENCAKNWFSSHGLMLNTTKTSTLILTNRNFNMEGVGR